MRIKKFPKYTLLLVQWDDILSDSSWHDAKGIEKARPAKIKTLGFFLGNAKRVLKLAHSVAEDGESDYTVIPWGTIKEIEEVRTKDGWVM